MTQDGPSDWFEPLYANAQRNSGQIPWALMGTTPYLEDWLKQQPSTSGQSAAVVACGLGDDAEALAAAGYQVTAFDISETAIRWAQERFPNSPVDYVVADLFELPTSWTQTFDVVFEFRTIQALPLGVRAEVMERIADLVAPQGVLLVATYMRGSEAEPEGPPWPLSATELAYFETLGLKAMQHERFKNKDSRFAERVRVEYRWAD
ncbi:MAG: class I SAM-dependent methyltransferase [Cyanobacteria bacterium P01_F01_bin.4]